MPDAQEVGAFLDAFWGTEPGRVYLATLDHGENFRQAFTDWPTNRNSVIQAALAAPAKGLDVFFAPPVFKPDAPKPEKEYVQSVNARWIDFDGNAPADWAVAAKEKGIPEPSAVLQSSVEGHQHTYWFTERTTDIESVETTNRALSATFQADMSGWDVNQLLRIPGTLNFGYKSPTERKPWFKDEPVAVEVIATRPGLNSDEDFSGLRSVERAVLDRLKIGEIIPIQQVFAYGKWTAPLLEMFNFTKEEASEASPNKRSGTLQRLAYTMAESEFTDEQIYSALLDADTRWEKYLNRSKAGRDKILRDTIARARAKVGYLSQDDLTLAGIVGSAAQEISVNDKIVYNFGEFMEADFHVDWLMEGLIAKGGIGLLVGQPGVGKTTLGLQLGMSLASGDENILNMWNTAGESKVLVLSCEMGANPLSYFVTSLAEDSWFKTRHRQLTKNLFLAPLGSAIHLDTPAGQQFVDRLLSQYQPDLVILDSIQKATSKPITDELATKALTEYLQKTREKHETAILAIHHERKRSSERTGFASSGELSDVYGSTFLAADMDFVSALRKTGTHVSYDEYKNRLAQERHDVLFDRNGMMFTYSDQNQKGGPGVDNNGFTGENFTKPTGFDM